MGPAAIKLTALPGICEAVATGFSAVGIFGMSIPMGLTLGFILAAVSPAVVVIGMFELQQKGEVLACWLAICGQELWVMVLRLSW